MSDDVLKSRTLCAYGSLALPIALAEIPILVYLPAFYAKEIGLSVGLVGIVFLLARCWDALSDLLIGWFSDQSRSRFGRRKPWVMVGAPFLMLAAWFLCQPPDSAGLIYLTVWVILFYTAHTAIKIPYWSWGAELASSYEQRSRIVAYRESGTMAGNLIFATAPVLFLAGDASIRDVLWLIALSIIILMPLTIISLGLVVVDKLPENKIELHFFEGLQALGKNGPMIRMLVMALFLWFALGVINAIAVFLIDVGLGLPDKLFLLVLVQYATALMTVPIAVRLANRFGKHIILMCGLSVTLIAFLAGSVVPLGNFKVVLFLWVIIGAGFSTLLILPLSILADIVDYDTVATGEQRSGSYVAAYNLMTKIGLAVGVGMSFGLLDMLNYNPSSETYSTEDIVNVRIVGFVIPSLLLIPAIFILGRFPITKQLQQQLREKIESGASSAAINNQAPKDGETVVNARRVLPTNTIY